MARREDMHFLAVTEHNHRDAERGAKERTDGVLIATQPQLYGGAGSESLMATANRMTENGQFGALYGQEFSTISSGNHMNVLDAPRVIPDANGAFDDLMPWLDANRYTSGAAPLVQFNHPKWKRRNDNNYGRDDFGGDDALWVAAVGTKASLIEVLNTTATKPGQGFRPYAHEREYFEYLNLGFRLGPTVGHDNHYRNWGTSNDARTGVVAASLGRVMPTTPPLDAE